MARDLLKVVDALDRAEGCSRGLDALISLLASAEDADVPDGKDLCELMMPLHSAMREAINEARAGLKSA